MSALERLGTVVRDRRLELGLTLDEVRQRGGPSDTTMTDIENGRGGIPRGLTLRKLEEALELPAGTLRHVLDDVALAPREQPYGSARVTPPGYETWVVTTPAGAQVRVPVPVEATLDDVIEYVALNMRVVLRKVNGSPEQGNA